jgi:hypothetical protein
MPFLSGDAIDLARKHMDARPAINPLPSVRENMAGRMHSFAATVPFLGGWTLTLRKLSVSLAICLCAALQAPAQEMYRANALVRPGFGPAPADFDQIVIPISELKIGLGIESKFGTGFCLDPGCRLIATNYHVAAVAQPSKIDGQPIVDRFLATGPNDDGATVNIGPTAGAIKYTLSRDLAILELRKPLPHHHGAAFSLDELQPGQRVEIYAYPKESNRASRKLLRFAGTYKGETTSGLLAFDYAPEGGDTIQPGASGGVVVDAQSHRIVGVLNGVDLDHPSTAVAVPVQSLADFVTKVEPFLATTLFPSRGTTPPDAEDIYPEYAPRPPDRLQHRGDEPAPIKQLRESAQQLADGMRNLIAVQRLAWGSGNKDAALHAAYEVRVIDGAQKFREYPAGKTELDEIPLPPLSHSIVPALEWSELPEMVGKQLNLKVHQAPDAVVNEKHLKIFQYSASIEDAICGFTYVNDHILFRSSKTVRTSCYGEVWTDEGMNIVRMSEHYKLPGERKIYHVVVTYGLLTRSGEAPRTIPITIAAKTEDGNRVDWCRGQFTDYKIFGSEVRILAEK